MTPQFLCTTKRQHTNDGAVGARRRSSALVRARQVILCAVRYPRSGLFIHEKLIISGALTLDYSYVALRTHITSAMAFIYVSSVSVESMQCMLSVRSHIDTDSTSKGHTMVLRYTIFFSISPRL